MDNVILDVVLGLVLIYLLMALLVSKVQEVWAGQLRASRTYTMHQMLLEAVGRDAGLKEKVLANPAIFALSRGAEPAKESGGWTSLGTAQGPSAIPADLFARALLVELYDDGKSNPPSARYTPDAFVQQVGGGKTGRIWGTLRGLLPGSEGSWPRFEEAIAGWYKAIGERADGWYQRSAQTWSFYLALLLAALLNVDTFHVADRLANEPDLRRSLSTLAQNVSAMVRQEQAQDRAGTGQATTAVTPPPLAPDRRAEQALNQAAALLTAAYFRNEDVAKFDPNVLDINVAPSASASKPASNSASQSQGTEPVPKLIGQCAGARFEASNLTTKYTRVTNSTVFLSNPINWVYLMPLLQAELKIQRRPLASTEVDPKRIGLNKIHDCIANLSGWVALAAQRPGKDAAAQDSLRDAATQLSRAADALLEMLQDAGMPLSFQKLFLVDPKAFSDCSADATVSREGLRQCVLASQTGRVNLPLGWTESNRRLSFCHVVTFALKSKPTKPTPPVHDEVEVKNPADPGAWDHFVCGTQINFAGNEALRLPRIQLEGPGGGDLIAFVIGLFITAFFVALGAPFWFDVLGRAVKLRAAGGKARDDALTTPDGGRGGGAPGGSALPPGPGGDEPFSPARNDIERRLPAGDLIALQGALGVERTGVWDRATRQRMADESLRLGLGGSDELTNQLYLALLGRSPAGLTVLQPPSSSIKLRAEDSRCTVTADALMRLVAFPGRVPITANTMNDDLRALAVLWRYKNEAESNPLPHTRPVRTRANARHELDDISAAELAAILEQSKRVPALTYARESAPWLDWALGELGQGEACDPAAKTRDASNPRILEYHAAAGSPADVESTAWCASFVSWVLTRYNQTCPPNTAVTSAAAPNASHFGGAGSSYGTSVWSATGAISWAAVPAAAPVLAGDVITFHVSTGHAGVNHVGFVLEVESGGAWVLSGNFSNRVGIDFFTVPAIVEIRRP